MLTRSILTAAAMLAACAAGAQAQTSASATPPALTALDYIEIEQLVMKYGWALDSGADNGYAYADLYTADGTFTGTNQGPNGRSYTGREALAALARGGRRGPLYVSHLATNVVITPTAEGATGRSYVAILDVGARGSTPGAGHGGFYDDVFVRTPQGWRFKSRTYYESKWGEPDVTPPPAPVPPLERTAIAPAPAPREPGALTAADYVAIQQLVSRYPFALDQNGDGGASYAGLFAPGAVFHRPRTTGAEALAALAETQPHGSEYTRHFIFNHVIEPAPGGAKGRQYVAIIDIAPRGQPHAINLVGLYEDDYVKTPDGWRFMNRTFTPAVAGGNGGNGGR